MSQTEQPDWDRIAEKFDLWLPYIEPAAEALISRLDAHPDQAILDVACGTGEPALTLARRLGGRARITGTDQAPGMVRAASAKAAAEGLEGITFRAMAAESMDFPDASFDRVICRFGVMLFSDPVAGLAEMWRVLKPGGRFALAVWGDPEVVAITRIFAEAIEPRIPDGVQNPLAQITSLGPSGVLEAALETAGFESFSIVRDRLDYHFESFEAYWKLVEDSAIIAKLLDAIPADQHAALRDEVAGVARAYHQEDGRLVLPNAYLVAHGTR
jgi:ubiquinone/menaquinone biosynthesis C-methylase UbiE